MTDYQTFLDTKRISTEPVGFVVEDSEINQMLFDWQRAITRWAISRGRSALFLDTGLGKSAQQLEWAHHVSKHTGGNILILAPLAVSNQTKREADKFGIKTPVTVCRSADDIGPGINISNYERLHHFSPEMFTGIVLDESSILKGFSGKIRARITEFARSIKYRLACSATPSPNDLIELANHAEFLDVMSGKEIIALFFRADGNSAHNWKLKKHSERDFWLWMAEWSVSIRKPSDFGYDDTGFDLPPLVHHACVVDGKKTTGFLFPIEARTMTERRNARRDSIVDRVKKAAEIVATHPDDSWLIWCDLNAEGESLRKAIPSSIEIKGADKPEFKEKSILDFVDGKIKILITKPTIAGFGMNLQNCHRMIFVGLSDSFEQMYQATRRCWRFGQENQVDVYVVTAETEGAVVRNIQRKERQANQIFENISRNMAVHELNKKTERKTMEYIQMDKSGNDWKIYLGDSIEVLKTIDDNIIGLSVFSPPFSGMYAYTDSPRDVGNCKGIDELIEHFDYMLDDLYRVTMPGRSCCIHLAQEPIFKKDEGYSGLRDFRGEIIRVMQSHGWIFASERMIDKDPQLKAARTKDHGLAMKTAAKDSSVLTGTMPDYLLQFKKRGNNTKPIRALIDHHDPAKRNPNGWITREEWIQWASAIWYGYHRIKKGGIRETDVLSVRGSKDDEDEKHLCPLQIGVIERCIKLWSAPGDTVLDPFTGIGSTGHTAIMHNRKFIGIELKPTYHRVACQNIETAENNKANEGLSLFAEGE
jgi:DNA modification methylase